MVQEIRIVHLESKLAEQAALIKQLHKAVETLIGIAEKNAEQTEESRNIFLASVESTNLHMVKMKDRIRTLEAKG